VSRLDEIENKARDAAVPPPDLDPATWLDEHRVIPRGYPSAFPGPWRTARTPYLREPLEAFKDKETETVVLMFSSQIAKTECLLGTLLYAYGADPGPGMFVFPRIEDADKYSTQRLAPTLQACRGIEVGESAKATDDSKRSKVVNGYPFKLGGANSAAGLASDPVQYLWGDEVDRWPAELPNEGDPMKLATQRTEAFARRKHMFASTPTTKGASRIERMYEESDMCRLWVPCPRCGERFVVYWRHVRWETHDGDHLPETAYLEHAERDGKGELTSGCGGRIEDHERGAMYAAGEWRPDHPERGKKIRGFHAWAVACSWMPLERLVRQFIAAKRGGALREFINLKLGETWEESSVKVESSALLTRREEYATDVPAGVQIITAGVDTQDDRLEYLVVGWGEGEESWVIERDVIPGDPDSPETWLSLDSVVQRDWKHERGGSMRVQATLVDCLGHRTGAVYKALRTRAAWRMFASVGKKDGAAGMIVSPPKAVETVHGTVMRCVVGADEVKGLIYARLALEEADGQPRTSGAGVTHFPMTVGDAFFTELTAEHLVTKTKRGAFPEKMWEARPGFKRNESLDCFGMALAALRAVCPTPTRFAELAAKVEGAREAKAAPPTAAPAAVSVPRPSRTKGWTGR
jgi:phage terminase large subunit GpA-like protein